MPLILISLQEWRLHRLRMRQYEYQSRCGRCRMGNSRRNSLLDRPEFVGIRMGTIGLYSDGTRSQQVPNRVISGRRDRLG
jgi:hypothetical protein